MIKVGSTISSLALWLAVWTSAHAGVTRVNCDGLASADAAIGNAIRQAGSGGTVELSGICRVSGPIVISASSSGRSGAPFVLRGVGGAVVTGLEPLQTTSQNPAALAMAPSVARSHLIMYTLPPILAQRYAGFGGRGNAYGSKGASALLAQGEQPMRLARWPNEGFARASVDQPQKGPTVAPAFASDRAEAWAREPDLWAGGFWTFDWVYETAKVAKIDAGRVTLVPLRTRYDEGRVLSYFVYNAISELDQPGEFAVLPGGRILAWPAQTAAPVEIAQADGLLSISGAHDIRVEDLTLIGALDSGARVFNSTEVTLSHLRVTQIGGVGIQVEGGHNVLIDHADIHDTGETGVVLRGGDRKSLTGGGHVIIDSEIARFGQLTRAYRPGVQLDGVGLTIKNSRIHDGPHSGVIYGGNDHHISGNEIDHVVREAGDSGAIYAGRDLTARGTLIEDNFIHDVMPGAGPGVEVRGVYLDDYLSGQIVRRNLFLRVMDPIFIHGGSDNQVQSNVIVCSTGTALYVESIPVAQWQRFARDLEQARLKAQTPDALLRSRYPGFNGFDAQSAAESTGNLIEGNELPSGAKTRFDNVASQRVTNLAPAENSDCSAVADAAILSRWRRTR